MIMIPLFLPFLLWGAAALVGIFTIAGIAGAFDDPKKNKLGILGMQGAGKTLFLSFLRNIPFKEESTSREKYETFKYKIGSGKEITISAGMDIGGGNTYRSDYDKILNNADVILYFFDIDKYLKNETDPNNVNYQRSCNSRFEHISSKVKENKKPTLIIGTHRDKCNLNESEMKQQFNDLVQFKNYNNMFEDMQYVNLTSPTERRTLANKIFKGK